MILGPWEFHGGTSLVTESSGIPFLAKRFVRFVCLLYRPALGLAKKHFLFVTYPFKILARIVASQFLAFTIIKGFKKYVF